MALQRNGITVQKVETIVRVGTQHDITFLIGAMELKLRWSGTRFIKVSQIWIDGRRADIRTGISDGQWRALYRQAYEIARSRGW